MAPVPFRSSLTARIRIFALVLGTTFAPHLRVSVAADKPAAAAGGSQLIDLSLLVGPELPGPWPAGWPAFQINHYERIGPLSPYNSDILVIDGNNGTQLDVPPHSIPLPESNLPNAGILGRMFTDKVPAWQFGGEACVVDCRDILDAGAPGESPLVTRQRIVAWEKKHRPLGPGDVVLFRSDYTDKYYRPLPAGRRFIAEPLEGKTPAWPDPDPDCMEYLGSRKVMTLGTDSASMGPLPNLAEPTHLAGLKYGMIWTESATNLGKLPATGAFYCMVGPKHADGLYSEGRALAVVGDPLAARLIESARKKNVVDLSVTLSSDLPVTWPGRGIGNHRQPYLKVPLMFAPNLGTFHVTHMLDSHAGTHLVPPAYALPPAGFDNGNYAPQVREWLGEYEMKFGQRGTSTVTAEQVPLSQTCGRARVIDVKHLFGTAEEHVRPWSPEIGVAELQRFEKQEGELKSGDIVIFHSGHVDKYFKPMPEGLACLADPLNGKSIGWPAPGPDAIVYLAKRGIRCVATDGPTLGGVEPKRALMTYWALGTNGMVGVEFLTNVDQVPKEAYFVFAPVKICDCHGGPGRGARVLLTSVKRVDPIRFSGIIVVPVVHRDGNMSSNSWYSQLFENTYDGGVLLALPHDALADWSGTGDDYDEVIQADDQFLFRPIGPTVGLFVGDFDGEGIHEAHWMRISRESPLLLVVWSSWDDPDRKYMPEDMKKIARAWGQRKDPRQQWLEQRLQRDDLGWERWDQVQSIPSGVLLLLHAEGPPLKTRFAKPHAVAKCGQVVPAGVSPGDYHVETVVIDELPGGAHLCSICRWVPAIREAAT